MGFLSILKKVAPFIAGTFGTPLAGIAVQALCATLPADAAQDVQAAHAADPVNGAVGKLGDLFQHGVLKLEALRAADVAHAEKMRELGFKTLVDLEGIAAIDRDSARKREIAIKDGTPAILAYILIAGTGLAIGGTLLGYTKVDSALAGTLIGYLVAECRTALSYFFGTTATGKSKDDTIAEIAKS